MTHASAVMASRDIRMPSVAIPKFPIASIVAENPRSSDDGHYGQPLLPL